ncbi:hypothetical protein HYH03_002071 [Edaphochlamys debaryana]|uniref:Uncharacterized protein n=1 Tax=Edaphochlamys debaryana TaxID=47281 RepID=A0A835YLB4_9CHLO|nr:hypothetical protein HYH03_002071 [Edaphochlamys debaryana]|eukprot:KAG2499774.1 hypothetical protein HYH03_002071 [Edaphochlamys debaryana]
MAVLREIRQNSRQTLQKVSSLEGRFAEANVGRALRERLENDHPGVRAWMQFLLRDAASVVRAVLPAGMSDDFYARAEQRLTAWLADKHRGVRAILLEELQAVPLRLKAASALTAEERSKQDSAAQAALANLSAIVADQEVPAPVLRAAIDALSCCAGAMPVSLERLRDCVERPHEAEALLAGELCVPCLTALHSDGRGGAASSTAGQLELDRLVPLQVQVANDATTASLELQEVKASSTGLPNARDQLQRRGRVLACVYHVLRDELPPAASGGADLPEDLRLLGTVGLGADGDLRASAEQLPPRLELRTAAGRECTMHMTYLVSVAEALKPWVPRDQR